MGLAPLFADFSRRAAAAFDAASLDKLTEAWKLAESAHDGQFRQSGEPYVTHPLAVAQILLDVLEPDVDALCAALLHDVVEDTSVTLEVIERRFGVHVAHIVDGVSKLDQVRTISGVSSKEETLRKLIAAGGRDWRVFAVKLCDRLHNVRTLGAVPRAKQRRVAVETRDIFFPLAQFAGFTGVARELEAHCVRYLHPRRWQALSRWVEYKAAIDQRRLSGHAAFLTSLGLFPSATLTDSITTERVLRAFSLLREDRATRCLFALPVVDIVCSSVADAFRLLGLLQANFAFVPASFRSDVNEGILGCRVHLGGRSLVAEFVLWFPRVPRRGWTRVFGGAGAAEDLMTVASEAAQGGQLVRALRELVSGNTIQVFSPKGKRFSLPLHSSGLDFAFAVHSDIGLRAVSIRVNGVLRDVAAELHSGDVVEVVHGERVVASAKWVEVMRSPRARNRLRQWLREHARHEVALLGRRLLAEAANALTPAARVPVEWSEQQLTQLGVRDPEELFAQIGAGQLSAYVVLAQTADATVHAVIRGAHGMLRRSRLLLDGTANSGVTYCAHCMPVPDDAVFAVSTRDGPVVHRSDCSIAAKERRSANEILLPSWLDPLMLPLPCSLRVFASDRRGLLADCARAIADVDISVNAVSSESVRHSDGREVATLRFVVMVATRDDLDRCVAGLSRIVGVSGVVRADADLTWADGPTASQQPGPLAN